MSKNNWKAQQDNFKKLYKGKYVHITPTHEAEPVPLVPWHTSRQYFEIWDGEKFVLVSTRYGDVATDEHSRALKEAIEPLAEKRTLVIKAITK